MSPQIDPTATVARPSGERRAATRPTLAVTAVIVSAAIPPFLIGALAPLIGRDMPLDATGVGLAIAAYYLVSGLLSPLGGRAVDRIGVVMALRMSCGITALGLLAVASASAPVHLIVVLGVLGLPNSLVQPAANAALAELRSPRLRAFSFGVVQAAIPAGTLIAGVVLGVSNYGGSWRWTVLAVAALTVATIWLTRGLSVAPRSDARSSSPAAVATPRPPLLGGTWILVSLVATGFLASAAATSLPSFVVSTGLATGLAPAVVAGTQAVGSLACATTRIAMPLGASHATPQRRLFVIVVLLGVSTLGYLSLGSGTSAGFLVGAVLAYAFGWGWNGLFNLVVVSVRPERVAAATGMTQGGVFLGGMAGPLVFAALVDHSGFAAAWLVTSGWAVAAAISALVGVVLLLWSARGRAA